MTVTNDVQTPTVNVAAPAVTVTNEVQTPNVSVTNDVKTPTVNVAAPDVTVRMPTKAQPAINVSVPAELRIVSMPDRVTQRVVKRDRSGQIVETTDVETDA